MEEEDSQLVGGTNGPKSLGNLTLKDNRVRAIHYGGRGIVATMGKTGFCFQDWKSLKCLNIWYEGNGDKAADNSEATLSPLTRGRVAPGRFVRPVTGRSTHCLVFSLERKGHRLLLQMRKE